MAIEVTEKYQKLYDAAKENLIRIGIPRHMASGILRQQLKRYAKKKREKTGFPEEMSITAEKLLKDYASLKKLRIGGY